ncbi:MAG TPA: hypothetical protein DCL64_08290 [Ruminococcaceae bacterium]|jgi:hypothetical protein|nr:hypothetical protein [Oscillospiraceae bacterium]HBQ46615.1 hypothetical protein [Oscillospiraceae bacterium]
MADSPDRRNMQTLQEEAIRRAREMQARAQIPSSYIPPRPRQGGAPHPRAEQMPLHPPGRQPRPAPARADPPAPRRPSETPPRPPEPQQEDADPPAGALDILFKDSERTLILMLLLILMEEKADHSLIFALLYLLI